MNQQTFDSLMSRVWAGERDAVGTLLVAAFESTRRAAVGCMDKVLAMGRVEPEDIVQETYASAWSRVGEMQFSNFEGLLAWLRTIAENKAIDLRRGLLTEKRDVRREAQWKVTRSYVGLVEQMVSEGSTPSRKVARNEAIAITMVQMAQLPQDYRQVIQWRVIQSLSVSQVAELMGRSEDAVHMLCYRALKKLSGLMGDASNYLSDH